MKSKKIAGGGETTFALIFDKGDEFTKELLDFAKAQGIRGGHLTAIGAFSDVLLGYFDKNRKEYKKIPFREQVEVLSLVGDIAVKDDEPKLHAHVVVGKSDGTARGGHILEAPRLADPRSDPDRSAATPAAPDRRGNRVGAYRSVKSGSALT
jgi:predicted DNA-binding protein with PD1-like motif